MPESNIAKRCIGIETNRDIKGLEFLKFYLNGLQFKLERMKIRNAAWFIIYVWCPIIIPGRYTIRE